MSDNILFVDDDQDLLYALRRVLRVERPVWHIFLATDFQQAWNVLETGQIDTAVLDVRMPGKDGFELLQSIKADEDKRDIPVVMLTGSADWDLKRKALDQGATDLLNKPVDLSELEARLQNILNLKSYEDRLKAMNATLEREVEERTLELEASRLDVIWRLAKAGEYRDEGTGNHVVRVGYYCSVIAEELMLPREFTKSLLFTSPLHDIGKIGIPDAVLLKPASLSITERRVMEQHCRIGAEILQRDPKGLPLFSAGLDALQLIDRHKQHNKLVDMAASIALSHHERWDGKGYPQKMAGAEIPLESRIVAIADVYDALSCARPYKEAYAEEDVLMLMRPQNGQHFDPDVFAAFERSLERVISIKRQFPDTPSPDMEEAA